MKSQLKVLTLTTLASVVTTLCFAAETVTVESRKTDGTPNTPAWTEVSGKWKPSKNKTKLATESSLVATNVSIIAVSTPAPAFKISPAGLETNTSYKVEVTFNTSKTQPASADLIVGVKADGVIANTISTNTPAFQGSGANAWTLLGNITPSTTNPTLTFTYVSGTLSTNSRWYADALRFTPEPAVKKAE